MVIYRYVYYCKLWCKISEVANNVQSSVKYTLENSLNVKVNSINIFVQGVRLNNKGK